MVQGRNLQELIMELKRQEGAKRDFMAVTQAIEMIPERRVTMVKDREVETWVPNLKIGEEGAFPLTALAHDQLGQYLKIPARYYDRMAQEAPELLVDSVNTWLKRVIDRRFIRVLDDRVRAFLSNAYKVMDNLVVVGSALEALSRFPNIEVKSCEVTDRRVYIAAITPDLTAKVAGDVIHGGLRVSNSEVGLGMMRVETFIYVLKCTNGATGIDAFSRRHVGRRIHGEEEAYEIFADDTIRADRRALGLKIRDTVNAALSDEKFNQTVKLLEDASARELPADAVKPTIQEVTKKFSLTEAEGDGILAHLLAGGDLNQWGLGNAVTALANDEKSYDHAYDLEKVGGQIFALDDNQWGALVKKAA